MEPDSRTTPPVLPVGARAMMHMVKRVVAIALASLVASPALAQDDDWDLTRDPASKLISAHISLSSGLVLAARCLDGRFDAVIGGLPEAAAGVPRRTIQITSDDEPVRYSTWSVASNRTVALADFPAAVARIWRKGGRFQVRIPDGAEGGGALRHDVILPASSVAIGEALTACGKPLEDARDALLPDVPAGGLSAPFVWRRIPRPDYPSNTRYTGGWAALTCVVQPNGALRDCAVESEHPHDGGFGAVTLRAAPHARVDVPGETRGSYSPRLVAFVVRLRLQ